MPRPRLSHLRDRAPEFVFCKGAKSGSNFFYNPLRAMMRNLCRVVQGIYGLSALNYS